MRKKKRNKNLVFSVCFNSKKYRNKLLKDLEKNLSNLFQQAEAHSNLLSSLNGGISLPAMRGWAVSPDFGLCIRNIIDANDYDVVIEFGSGVSTLIIASMLSKPGSYPNIKSHVAVDHLKEFCFKTQQSLNVLTESGRTEVWWCPLVLLNNLHQIDGDYKYYDINSRLSEHFKKFNQPLRKILLVVDGPPGSIGRWSRFPALPLIVNMMPSADIDIFLDDYYRNDEKEIGEAWLDYLTSNEYAVEKSIPPTEKGALFIRASKIKVC